MSEHARRPKGLTGWIIRRFIPGGVDPNDLDSRTRVGLLEGWVTTLANLVLFAPKIWLWTATGSISLLGDAIHTLSDVATSVVIIVGFGMAKKPADKAHPFGHGRVESISAVVIAVLLGVVAFEIGRDSIQRLIHPQDIHPQWWKIAILAATLVLKEWVSRFAFKCSDLINSDALRADAWHSRSDVLATGLVVVAFIGASFEMHWLDGAMGLGVAGIIAWAAYANMAQSIGPLMGEPEPAETYDEIEKIARQTQGVLDVHDVMVHRYGMTRIISLHIEVPATLPAMQVHEMCDEIEAHVGRRFPGHTIVHADPLNVDHPYYPEVSRIVKDALAKEKSVVSFHDLRIVGGERMKVVLDIATTDGRDCDEVNALRERLLAELRRRFPHARLSMDVEPPYMRNVPGR